MLNDYTIKYNEQIQLIQNNQGRNLLKVCYILKTCDPGCKQGGPLHNYLYIEGKLWSVVCCMSPFRYGTN